MDLANEAIHMSEALSLKRRQKLERDLAGRESLDEANFWHPRSGNFSVFGNDPITEAREEQSSFAERDTSPKRPNREQINISSRRYEDDTSPEPSKEEPPKEENKLAALNDLIKNQMFNPSTVDDADDFDTFLIKLNQRRSPPKDDISTVSSKYEESQTKQDYRKRLDEEFSIKLPEPLPIRETPVKPAEEAPLEHTFNPKQELHEESKDQSQLSIVQSKYEDLMQFLENADQTAAQALSHRS